MVNRDTLTKKAVLFGVSKFKLVNFITILFVVLFISCNKDTAPDIVKTTGKTSTQKRILSSFNTVELYSNIQLLLIADTIDFIEIQAGENLLPKIYSGIKSNTLVIKNTNKFNFMRSYKDSIIAKLHYKNLGHIKYYGAGNITTQNILTANEFAFESWYGSGHCFFNLNTTVSSFGFHTGIVDLELRGTSAENRLYATEQGIIQASNLNTKTCLCNNRGVANFFIKATTEIGVEISGEGNINYTGNATIAYSKITGKGKLIKQ